MKKRMLVLILAATMSFTACSKTTNTKNITSDSKNIVTTESKAVSTQNSKPNIKAVLDSLRDNVTQFARSEEVQKSKEQFQKDFESVKESLVKLSESAPPAVKKNVDDLLQILNQKYSEISSEFTPEKAQDLWKYLRDELLKIISMMAN